MVNFAVQVLHINQYKDYTHKCEASFGKAIYNLINEQPWKFLIGFEFQE